MMQRFCQFTLDLFAAGPGADLAMTRKVPHTERTAHDQTCNEKTPEPENRPDFQSNQALAPVLRTQPAIDFIANDSPDSLPPTLSLPRLDVDLSLHDVPTAAVAPVFKSPRQPGQSALNTVASNQTQQMQALAQALPTASFRHPLATREIVLGGVQIAYELKRGKRRTIGFTVGHEGLAVSAPKWVTLVDVDKAVREKAVWIVKKLQETHQRHQHLEAARIDWQDGALIRFLGRDVRVVLAPSHAFSGPGAALESSGVAGGAQIHAVTPVGPEMRVLYVGLPQCASAAQIRDVVQAWLMRQARQIFIERLNHFQPALGVQWRKLGLSSAGTRWGSASADGSIRLNWRLIHFQLSVIDYVVAHELSHLRVMDHSPRFWDTVRKVVPDYAELRKQLKAEPLPRW